MECARKVKKDTVEMLLDVYECAAVKWMAATAKLVDAASGRKQTSTQSFSLLSAPSSSSQWYIRSGHGSLSRFCVSRTTLQRTRSQCPTPTMTGKYVLECGPASPHTSMVSTSGSLHDSYSSRAVTFNKPSQGQLALVVYEWGDMEHLGKVTSTVDDLPVSIPLNLLLSP